MNTNVASSSQLKSRQARLGVAPRWGPATLPPLVDGKRSVLGAASCGSSFNQEAPLPRSQDSINLQERRGEMNVNREGISNQI